MNEFSSLFILFNIWLCGLFIVTGNYTLIFLIVFIYVILIIVEDLMKPKVKPKQKQNKSKGNK